MKNKRIYHISNIMSKRRGNLTENFTIFYSSAGKVETCRNSNSTNSRKPFFGDDINATFKS